MSIAVLLIPTPISPVVEGSRYFTISLYHISFVCSLHNIADQLFMSQSRSSPSLVLSNAKKDDKHLAHSEIVDRFKVLLQKATDFVFMSGM